MNECRKPIDEVSHLTSVKFAEFIENSDDEETSLEDLVCKIADFLSGADI